ncbi:MAG: glycoside hydrolase family 9 protein [Bacteroidales bacterium]|nr:glycoside hydrolase family 9 protein [Bacteroidales bacterium]
MNTIKTIAIIAALTGLLSCGKNENSIRINQVGFYPGQEKTMTLEEYNKAEVVTITDAEGSVVWEGSADRSAVSPWSGKIRRIFDFSEITESGTYTIHAGGDSATFIVSRDALKPLADAALTAFYHQRSGMDLDPEIAGKWARKGGHPDTLVYVHASAASASRPEGTVISSPKGWYDAGDYNKYVVNSGYSMGLMANAFRVISLQYAYNKKDSRKFWDELEYNHDWLLTMQDPEDGGVYHKLTTPSFEGFITPGECQQKRYVVQKSVTASLDFAAVCAEMGSTWAAHHGGNLEADINTRGVWEKAEDGADAYQWAKDNPEAFYHQDKMNGIYDPDVVTGAYGDGSASDELFWAATSQYMASYPGDRDVYLTDVIENMPEEFTLMSWGNVAALGVFNWIESELHHRKFGEFYSGLPDPYAKQKEEIKGKCVKMLLEYCDESIKAAENSCYNSAYGNSPDDFGWGCCSSFCDQAICFLYAYELTGNRKYVDNAFRNVNYILGQNATGYCYVTGFGYKSPMFPHSRLCHSDGIEEPIPGLLAGGPNPAQQDIAEVRKYHSSYPDESYEDVMPSYASNEVAINWNASLVAAITWLSYIGNEL